MVAPGQLILLLVPVLELGQVPPSHGCLTRSYRGTFGLQRVFIIDEPCWRSSFSLSQLGTPVRLQVGDRLGWIARDQVDRSIQDTPYNTELEHVLNTLRPSAADLISSTASVDVSRSGFPESEQASFKATQAGFKVLHRGQDGALLAVSDDAILEGCLPRFWHFSRLPTSAIPLVPVPPHAKSRLRELLPTIKYNHVVASVVNGISVHRLRRDIQYLTGEDPTSDILSRHSFSVGAQQAAAWLKAQFEGTGASCILKDFQEGFAPNVICEYPASENTSEIVILGAHYDDRGSFGSVRAPGANDDGSGTGALVAIARAIARRGVVFRKRVQLCAFAGEEQFMVGSRAYAGELREQGANVTLMIQGDMLAYHVEGEPLQLGLSDPTLIGSAEVTQLLATTSDIYSPELTVGYSPYRGGSDHQSFDEQGYPAAQVFERIGYIKDPMYHDSGDVSEREGYDFEQIKSIAKVELAAVLHVAGFDLSDPDKLHEDDEDGDYDV